VGQLEEGATSKDAGLSASLFEPRAFSQPRKFGSDKRYALAEHEDKVRTLVAEKPDLTITELWQ